MKEFIGDEIWNSYYKFCFERNPWDRIISLYYWRNKTEPRMPISEFLDSPTPQILKQRGHELYSIDGKIAVDKVCLYENLTDELEAVRKKVGIPEPLELPRAKSKFRKDKKSYHELLGEEEKQRVAELFSDEIKTFGYQF